MPRVVAIRPGKFAGCSAAARGTFAPARMGPRSTALLLLRLLGEPAPAEHAPAEHVELRWAAPPGCPDAAAVHRAIAAIVVDDPRTDGPKPQVQATIRAVEDRFELALVLASSRGTRGRTLTGARCESLVDAVAIEAALLVEAELAARGSEPPAIAPPRPPSPPRSVERRDDPSPVIRPPLRWRPAWRLRAGVAAGASVIEDSFVAPTLGASLVGRRWSSAIDLMHWPAGLATAPGADTRGARLSLSTVGATGCARAAQGRFAVAACGGVELGLLVARGAGLDRRRTIATSEVAATLGPGFELGLGPRVLASVAPWIRLALRRPGIAIDGVGELARPRIAAFGATLRLEVEIVGRKPAPRRIPRARAR